MLNLAAGASQLYGDALPFDGGVILDLVVTGQTMIAPQWQSGLYTFDLAEPTLPQLLSAPEDDSSLITNDLFSYLISDNVIYLSIIDPALVGGIAAVDLSDPANPRVVSTFETGDYGVTDMAATNGYLYILINGTTFTIQVYDISDPLNPTAVNTITLPEATSRIGVDGDTLIAACDRWNCQSLYTIDVSDPASAEITGQWQLNAGALDLIPAGNGRFYMPTQEEGLWLLSASDPATPTVIGQIYLPGEYTRLKIQDGVVYAAAYNSGLYLLAPQE
jgi:hypothetical protein